MFQISANVKHEIVANRPVIEAWKFMYYHSTTHEFRGPTDVRQAEVVLGC
jgi:hypothetical protein